uniref:Chromobox 7 n=1 Tax=Sciurus vulgaris TaxID=55149 RepID=A0A8D2D469_SCIVU
MCALASDPSRAQMRPPLWPGGTGHGARGGLRLRPALARRGEVWRDGLWGQGAGLERRCRCPRAGAGLTPCPGLPPQRLYSMDLRSSHKAKGKEKLCFSLTRPLGSGSPKGVVKAGAPELVDKGPLVPSLPFPLCKPRKAHKYLRLSRKKFPPRGPHLESHSHRRELSLQEPPAPDDLQAAGEWEPAEQPPEEADAELADGPPPWTPTLPSSEVTVTDITANSITVTFREAQAAEGFFRDRSEKL